MKFDESKVISSLHPEKAKVGKMYYASDSLMGLKNVVEKDARREVATLLKINEKIYYPFIDKEYETAYQFLYPYEEPKKRMTNRQLAEWLARGFGQVRDCSSDAIGITHSYFMRPDNAEVGEEYKIRCWGSDEWIEPTEEIFLRDCRN